MKDIDLVKRAKHIIENGGLLARDTALALIEQLEAAQRELSKKSNGFFVRLAAHETERADAAEAELKRRDAQKSVSFDSIRDSVAEVTGGIPVEWREGESKGHHDVPFMNFNSLSRIVNKYAAAPAAVNSPVIPDGWVIVPAQADLKMIQAGAEAGSKGFLIPGVYSSMIQAAPAAVPEKVVIIPSKFNIPCHFSESERREATGVNRGIDECIAALDAAGVKWIEEE